MPKYHIPIVILFHLVYLIEIIWNVRPDYSSNANMAHIKLC